MSDTRQESCKERLPKHLKGRIEDLEMLKWAAELEQTAGNDEACLSWEEDEDDPMACANCTFYLGDHWDVLEKIEAFESGLGYSVVDEDGNIDEDAATRARDEYPLCVDSNVVMRIQISTGGPGDEFLVTVDPEDGEIGEIRYRFLDWFDGATETLSGNDYEVAEWFCQPFVEIELETMKQRGEW